ncbi:HlyD family secretion protein [Tahibacter harae]|uniref:HlyD family efflux transporter periplasmic adaptor subunit n=1 Tax=Tahibacter harae TaxID=2963937 RepID=A0ABT1QQG5_9GAMM|nr:biotin/lipoyl-binding protein [Tahibacter harae]MCQ4164536.1 HlyD family efflux transporter periplasmic adaptor subunit [Tahibacter harae]
MSISRILVILAFAALLAACAGKAPPPLLGTLEWDRIAIQAEAAEPIVAIAVREGDSVAAGQLLLQLDPRRADAQLAQAQAELARAGASQAELQHGARSETLAAARAELARAEAGRNDAQRERERAAELRRQGLVAQAELDRRDTALKSARAEVNAAQAKVLELSNGTRPEQLDQADAAVAAAQARVDELRIARERLDVRASQPGRVDAIPYKLGDQPPRGASVISLLAGPAPYARLFVPAPRRATLQPGQRFTVQVAGIAQPYAAQVRALRSEASFTPYYALSGDDANRLSYRVELQLDACDAQDCANAPRPQDLPAGLPLTAASAGHGR